MSASIELNPRYVPGTRGNLFVVEFVPGENSKGLVVFLPPIGEEMNRCRKLMSDQARTLARNGYQCWVLDYFGTGDSEGAFDEAEWATWLADIECVLEGAPSDLPIILWGIRAGALVALEYMAANAQRNLDKAILFQPVASGSKYVTQMLRQRSAYLVSNELPQESAADMKARIEEGQSLEIGGYIYGGSLLQSLRKISIDKINHRGGCELVWMENVAAMEDTITPAGAKAVATLEAAGFSVAVKPFCDPPIWQLHERAEVSHNLTVIEELLVN